MLLLKRGSRVSITTGLVRLSCIATAGYGFASVVDNASISGRLLVDGLSMRVDELFVADAVCSVSTGLANSSRPLVDRFSTPLFAGVKWVSFPK
jgi:hypothetical protein